MGRNNPRHFITLMDYTSKELEQMIDLADDMKKDPDEYRKALKGQTLGMIFAKNSTRTRISFETGIFQLGGMGLFLSGNDLQLSRGETIHDTAKVLSRYLDGIMIRTFKHSDVEELAKYGSVPVINGLTDYNHPCQAMADIMTIREKFGKKNIKGMKYVYVGDGNNVTFSSASIAAKFGMDFYSVTPKQFALGKDEQEKLTKLAKECGTKMVFTDNIEEGVRGAHVIYTDTWISMGQDAEKEKKLNGLKGFEVSNKMMAMADKKAIFMHCLPAHRGEEVLEEVIDGPQSVIFDEAENRLHAQKAVMYTLMKK